MRGGFVHRLMRVWRPALRTAPWSAGLQARLRLAGLALLVAIAAPAAAEVPLPAVVKAKGECVEAPAVMRRSHMEFLKHQRDDTMRLGKRDGKFSLKACIDCHAVPGADGKPVTVADPKHFCSACHSYAAVAPDCFQCHSSVPEPPKAQATAAK